MKLGATVWVPVVLGAVSGAAFALIGTSPSPPPEPETGRGRLSVASATAEGPSRSLQAELTSTQTASEPASGAAESVAASVPAAPAPGPLASAVTPTSSAAASPPGASPPAGGAASSAIGASSATGASELAKGSSATFDLSLPGSAEELYRIEVRCDRKSAEDCERAAGAIEKGAFAAPDAARAHKLRRVALTLYVKQCNQQQRAQACSRLAEMYTTGELVKPSEVSAKALREKVQQLCKSKPSQPGCS